MSKYIRTTLKNFSELTARQVLHARDILGEDAEETQWVTDPTDKNACLPLCNFMRAQNSKLWDGFFGVSYFSGYFIKLDRSQEIATVGYRHW